jgi:hypothetical protein
MEQDLAGSLFERFEEPAGESHEADEPAGFEVSQALFLAGQTLFEQPDFFFQAPQAVVLRHSS